ncbi:acetylcholinesterase-like isoform X2 [Dermacentor albipictus]|uniref:acetylcholinesterase-like isoform X2 n=1 Tax=Dermacentor albipictus TaxID=60249 RepID=UPI0038FC16A5
MCSRSNSTVSSPRPPNSAYEIGAEEHDSSLSCSMETEEFEEEPKERMLVQVLEYGCAAACCATAAALALWILWLGRRGGSEHARQLRSLELSHSVVTSSGSLRGLWVDDGSNGSALAFYGVPYAEPPLGAARFQRPTPVRPWTGELRATYKAPPCPPQWLRAAERPQGKLGPDWTEDCLHVNIWTPGLSPAKLRPVVVLLHGGHFTHGSNRLRQYDGAGMATRCDCVVAVPNYRLGVFGFLFGNVSSFPGNQGLWDQHLALQWLKRNAAAFGGDPRNLVLWGVDAGAISAGLHILSPLGGVSLFSRAVLQGGSPLSCLGECADADNVRLSVAKLCASPDEAEDERRALACLQAALAAALVTLPVDDYFAQTLSPFLPTYGDPLVPVDPKVLAYQRRPLVASGGAAGRHVGAPLSVLVGFARGEGQHFLARFLDASTNGTWAHFTPDQHRSTASALFTFTFGEEILEAESLHTDLESLNDPQRVFRHYGALLDDALYVCPALAFAEYLSDAGLVHVYEFALVDHENGTPPQAPQHSDDFDAAFHYGADDYLEPQGAGAFADAVIAFISAGLEHLPSRLPTHFRPTDRSTQRPHLGSFAGIRCCLSCTAAPVVFRSTKPSFRPFPTSTGAERQLLLFLGFCKSCDAADFVLQNI